MVRPRLGVRLGRDARKRHVPGWPAAPARLREVPLAEVGFTRGFSKPGNCRVFGRVKRGRCAPGEN